MGKIAFLGDSITKATDYGGVTQPDTFAYKIGIGAGYSAAQIINAGVSSDTMAGMVARLGTDVFAKGASVCCCMPMTNDAHSGTTVASFKASLTAFVTQCRDNGVKPVFMSPPLYRGNETVMAETNAFLAALQDVAAANAVPLIDYCRESAWAYLCNSAAWALRYVDYVHQTVAGHSAIAEFALRSSTAMCFTADIVKPDPLQVLALASADLGLDPSSATKQAALRQARAAFP
ncbi:SGNH/GDSL hydrolase family protein [Achromobacter xylosoxidans]|uniref:SGNH/GDSL hydrolase family protein n=1 Tax=Alcaligenes xylosoxydans xylosoxydans TaxID=85698 RepID=UPI0038FD2CC4